MRFRNRVSILGFVIGGVLDIVGTNIWVAFMTAYVMVSYNLLQMTSPTEATAKVLDIFQTNPLIFSVNLIVGTGFSIMGGYLAAYIAKHDELLNGALSSFLCVLSGIYALFTGSYPVYLVLLEILALIISPLLGMLGGYLRLKQKSRKQIMAVELQPAASQQEIPPEPQVPGPFWPAESRKSNKKIWITIVVAVAGLYLCSIACVGLFGASIFGLLGTAIYKTYTEMAPVESVLDTFMQDMEAKDTESAYALFSPRAQRQIPVDDFQKPNAGNNYALFDGYLNLSVQNINLNATANTDPNSPQGTVADVDGFIEYSDGSTGSFTATLEKADGEWMIYGIHIDVPPEKYQPAAATPAPDELPPMLLVPAGEFTMGGDADDALAECRKFLLDECQRDWFADQEPAHQVYLDAFYMDTYEVTNARYKDCVAAGGCTPPQRTESSTRSAYYGNSQFDDFPVFVNWYQAAAYCAWRDASLPTEAQWEKAARGTDARTYPWGNDFNGNFANFCDASCAPGAMEDFNDGYEDTAPVGNYRDGVSPYGIYDLAGNVWEWTADWYSETYYQDSPASNPQGPDSGQSRALRGGAWDGDEFHLNSSFRYAYPPGGTDIDTGFRCVRSP